MLLWLFIQEFLMNIIGQLDSIKSVCFELSDLVLESGH